MTLGGWETPETLEWGWQPLGVGGLGDPQTLWDGVGGPLS